MVIGVHAPEFAFEKNVDNVRSAVADLKIDYPVAIDNDYAIWRAFNNQYWPAHYFIDARGPHPSSPFRRRRLRGIRARDSAACWRRRATRGYQPTSSPSRRRRAPRPRPTWDVQSPETYIGYRPRGKFHFARRRGRRYAATPTRPPRRGSTNGGWPAIGRSARRRACST